MQTSRISVEKAQTTAVPGSPVLVAVSAPTALAVRAAEAVAGVADHLEMFWDPRMRSQILAHLSNGGASLDPLVREAAGLMAKHHAPVA